MMAVLVVSGTSSALPSRVSSTRGPKGVVGLVHLVVLMLPTG